LYGIPVLGLRQRIQKIKPWKHKLKEKVVFPRLTMSLRGPKGILALIRKRLEITFNGLRERSVFGKDLTGRFPGDFAFFWKKNLFKVFMEWLLRQYLQHYSFILRRRRNY
jgi:hypothetical protein